MSIKFNFATGTFDYVGTTVGANGTIYIGDPNTNGSWRFTVIGNNLIVERRESGVWVEKSAFLAA